MQQISAILVVTLVFRGEVYAMQQIRAIVVVTLVFRFIIVVFLLAIMDLLKHSTKNESKRRLFRLKSIMALFFILGSLSLCLAVGVFRFGKRSPNLIQFQRIFSWNSLIGSIDPELFQRKNSEKSMDSMEAWGSAEGDQVSEIASNPESPSGIGYMDSMEAWGSAEGDQVSEIASNPESPSGSGYEADSDSTAEYRDAQTYSQIEGSSPSLTDDDDNGENAPYFQSQAALWVQASELVAFYFVFEENNNNVGMTRTFMQRFSNRPQPDASNFVMRSNETFALPKDSDDERDHHVGIKGLSIRNGPQPDNFVMRSNETFGLPNDSDYENNSVGMKRLNDIQRVPRIRN